MAATEEQLKQEAIKIANKCKRMELEFREEAKKAEVKAKELATKADFLGISNERGLKFTPSLNGDLQCPRCFINQGDNAILTPVPGDDDVDIYICKKCGFEFKAYV